MKKSGRKGKSKRMLHKLAPALIAIAETAHAGPPKPPAPPPPPPPPPTVQVQPPPPPPPLPPPPKFKDNNVLKIQRLKLTPALPKAGETVMVTLVVVNESPGVLSNVDWKLSGALEAAGRLATLPPLSAQTVTKTFTARAGALSVLAELDPAQRVSEPSELRANNKVSLTSVVASGDSQWWGWSRKAAERLDDLIGVMKAKTSVEQGVINATSLVIKKLRIGTFDTGGVKQKLIADGVPQDVAQAVVDTFVSTYKDWASSYTAGVTFAYPAFSAFPGPTAPPMANVPFPVGLGGSPVGARAIMPSTIEAELLSHLSAARKAEPDATSAVRSFAEACSGHFGTWLAVQQVKSVLGKGPVPTFAPPYVPVGPVVGGDTLPDVNHLP